MARMPAVGQHATFLALPPLLPLFACLHAQEYAQDLEQKLHHPPNQPSDGANGSGTCFTAGYLYSMYHVLLKVDRAATYAMLGFQDPAAVVRLE